MNSKLGIFSNANALLVGFDITHEELLLAKRIAPESLVIMDKDGKNEVFKLMNGENASASKSGAAIPFAHEDPSKKVEVLFTVSGNDTKTIQYLSAGIVQNLTTVESQIQKALKAVDLTASKIDMLSFGAAK